MRCRIVRLVRPVGDIQTSRAVGQKQAGGQVYPDKAILRPFAAVSGVKNIIQSHELDFADNKTEPGRVVLLGRKAVTTTGCILLKDSYPPERSVLAAGAVLRKAKQGRTCPSQLPSPNSTNLMSTPRSSEDVTDLTDGVKASEADPRRPVGRVGKFAYASFPRRC